MNLLLIAIIAALLYLGYRHLKAHGELGEVKQLLAEALDEVQDLKDKLGL